MSRPVAVLAGLLLLALPLVLGNPISLAQKWMASSGWEQVTGTLRAVRAINFDADGRRQSWGDEPRYEADVAYQYAGSEHSVKLTLEPTVAVSFVGRDAPKAGDRIELLVNPQKPQEVFRGRSEILALLVLMSAAAAGGAFLLWRGLRPRPAAR